MGIYFWTVHGCHVLGIVNSCDIIRRWENCKKGSQLKGCFKELSSMKGDSSGGQNVKVGVSEK